MAEAPIRWGILSTGFIAKAFAEALHGLPGAELLAVASRTQAKADAFGDRFGVPRRYGTYADLAHDPDVDIVYVATPHIFHAANAMLCLLAGKHVLCEKAFTINAREAEQLIDCARERKRFLMEAMYTRHHPVMRQVREWIAGGRIGEVRLVQANRCNREDLDPSGRGLNLDLGGGSLLDVGVYPLSFAAMAFRRPITAIGGHCHLGPTGADEQAAFTVAFEGGGLALLACSLRTSAPDDARICGTEGMIYIPAPFWQADEAILSIRGKEDRTVHLPVDGNGLQYEATESMRCIREGLLESPVMPHHETLALMHGMDKLRRDWGLAYPGEA